MRNTLLGRAWCQLRNLNAWLLAGLVLLAWPQLQSLLEAYVGKESAPWLPLGNPASKITVTVLVVAIGYLLMWAGLKLNHTTLAAWAKRKFKATFLALPVECKLKYFTIYWFGSLFFFALIWLGASLLQ